MEFKKPTQYASLILEHRGEPGYLADLQIEMASYYSYLNDMCALLKIERAKFWQEWKEKGEKAKSDEMLKMLWILTPDGQKELKLKTALVSLEKMLAAVKSSIVTASIELKDQA